MPAARLAVARGACGFELRGRLRARAVLLALQLLSGCASYSFDVPYYWQSVSGHWQLLRDARPIDEVIIDPATDAALRERLQVVKRIRAFATQQLAEPDNGSYKRYTDLHRGAVVWSVFAAPEFSLELKQWCFPVAGCVSYRGYYTQADAQAYAATLRSAGNDVYVAQVPAYSTLGWLDDPVLNTFVNYPLPDLAQLIFHELAHQTVYLKGDSTFNESFATTVEEVGVERWMQSDPAVTAAQREDYVQRRERRRQFVELQRKARDSLRARYAAANSDDERRRAKREVFEQMLSDYQLLKSAWGGWGGYDRWFGAQLNNAQLGSLGTYTDLVPAFHRLLHECNDDLPRFYQRVQEIAELDRTGRDRLLAR